MTTPERISDDSTPLDDDVCDDCHGSECLVCADDRRYHEDRDNRLSNIGETQ